MIASLGGSLLVIVLFFTGLATMLVLAVHMEATLQRPRSHRRLAHVAAQGQEAAVASDGPSSRPAG